MMKGDGTIIVQEQRLHLLSREYGNPGKKYELQKCLGHSLSNFVNSIMVYWDDLNSFRLEGLSFNDITSSFVIPGGKQRIGAEAFKNHSELKVVSIPDGIDVIGAYAFSGCSGLAEIHIPASVAIIKKFAFEGCSGLKEVYLSNVTEIGESAFKGCSGLTKIYIPDSVMSVGREVFAGCLSLKELSVSNGLDLSKSGLPEGVGVMVRNNI